VRGRTRVFLSGTNKRVLFFLARVDVEEAIDRVMDAAIGIVLAWMFLDTMAITTGIPLYEILRYVVTYWRIPWEWLLQFYPFWIALLWVFNITALADYFYATRYRAREGTPPPVSYARYLSLAQFTLAILLYLAFQALSFLVWAFFAAVTFGYSLAAGD